MEGRLGSWKWKLGVMLGSAAQRSQINPLKLSRTLALQGLQYAASDIDQPWCAVSGSAETNSCSSLKSYISAF